MVEFALITPVLLFILFAIIQFSILMVTNSAVSFAARQAARIASIHATDYSSPSGNDQICAALRGALRSSNANPNLLGTVKIFEAAASNGASELNASGDDNNAASPIHDVGSCAGDGT